MVRELEPVRPAPIEHRAPTAPVATPHGTPIPPPSGSASQGSGAHSFRPVQAPPAPAHERNPRPQAPAPAPAAAPGWREYVVKSGDVAGRLANDNGMYLKEFCEVNGISDPNKLQVGQKVKIATGRPPLGSGHAPRPPVDRVVNHPPVTPEIHPTPPKQEKTGASTTDIDALLHGGSLAQQREQAEKAKAEAEAAARAAAEKAKAEAIIS